MNDAYVTEAVMPDQTPKHPVGTARLISTGLTSVGRGVRLTALALWEALLLVWVCVCTCLLIVGLGVWLLPGALNAVRTEARRSRRLAMEFSAVWVIENYLPDPTAEPGLKPGWQRMRSRAWDPASWRDLLWLVVNPTVGPLITLLPAAAIIHGLWGLALPFLWEPVVKNWDNSWYAFLPLRGEGTAIAAAVLGVLEITAAVLLARTLITLHGRWVRMVLSTMSREQLQERVKHLSQTRSDAVTHEANEIRRIERDLHDGAQARLVAMGMTLTAAGRVMDENPEAARYLLQEAKQMSAAALAELRDLVRGIHPPVLADRGLVEAIKARALELPLQVRVHSTIEGRPPPPVESAMYFAACELLTNIAKHAGASEVDVDITNDHGTLRVAVLDDGHGGADPGAGTGLRGVQSRLAAFDGVLSVHSPEGGPTTVCVFLPCTLSAGASR